MREKIARAGAAVNRTGGRLFFGSAGILTGIAAASGAWLAWQALSEGELAGGVLAAAFALMMAVFTRYCWSPDRRLTDIDP